MIQITVPILKAGNGYDFFFIDACCSRGEHERVSRLSVVSWDWWATEARQLCTTEATESLLTILT